MSIFVLVVIGTIAWFLAPWFLPVYRWLHVDFEKIAAQAKTNGYHVTTEQVSTIYKVEFAYLPRHKTDPRPFVLLKMDPPYYDIVPDDDWSVDEDGLLLRCTVINDREGKPPSEFYYGSGQFKDRYFKAEAWRLPPKSLGLSTGDRPVILYNAMTLEKLSIGEAQGRQGRVDDPRLSIPDEDGWAPPEP